MTNQIEEEVAANRQSVGRALASDRQPATDQNRTLATAPAPVAVEVTVAVDTRPLNGTLIVGHPDGESNGIGGGTLGDQRGDWTEEISTVTTLTRDGRRLVAEALAGDDVAVDTATVGDATVNAFVFDGGTTLAWSAASDWDGASSTDRVVHAGYGDRTADELALGYDPTWLPSGLVAYWPLDSASGPVADQSDSGTTHDGAINGDPQPITGITGSSALDFDGGGDEIAVPMDDDLRPGSGGISYAFWFKAFQPFDDLDDGDKWFGATGTDGDNNDTPFVRFDHTFRDLSFDINGGQGGAGTVGAGAGDAFEDGDWHHVVGTYDGADDQRVFVDGEQKDQETASHGDVTPTSPLYMGSCAGDSTSDIELDEVMVFDRALSPSEVQTLYDAGSSGSVSDQGSFSRAATKPDLTGLDYALNSESITITVTGSPNGTSEQHTQSLDGSKSYSLSWSTAHQTFDVTIDLSTSDVTVSPTLSALTLE